MVNRLLQLCIALLVLAPSVAEACTVCGFGKDGSQQAFLVTTGIMTSIPLIALGGVLFFISRKRSDDDRQD